MSIKFVPRPFTPNAYVRPPLAPALAAQAERLSQRFFPGLDTLLRATPNLGSSRMSFEFDFPRDTLVGNLLAKPKVFYMDPDVGRVVAEKVEALLQQDGHTKVACEYRLPMGGLPLLSLRHIV